MKWRPLGSEAIFDARIFKLRRDLYEYDGEPTRPYYVLEAPAWVNVVPVTPDGGIVLVRQYRHGIRATSLEVPGGMVDTDESPAQAAARELLEETGHAGDAPRLLATVSSNPAILDNYTHCFCVRGARQVAAPTPDPHEDLDVVVARAGDIAARIASGEIHHSLSVCALTLYLGICRGHGDRASERASPTDS